MTNAEQNNAAPCPYPGTAAEAACSTFERIERPRRGDYTTVFACRALVNPNPDVWQPADDSVLANLTRLSIQGGVQFYGHL